MSTKKRNSCNIVAKNFFITINKDIVLKCSYIKNIKKDIYSIITYIIYGIFADEILMATENEKF